MKEVSKLKGLLKFQEVYFINDPEEIGDLKELSVGAYTQIGKDVKVGKNVKIGAFSIIGDGVELDDNSVVGSYSEIGKGTKVGKNSILQGRIRTADNCLIEEDVVVKYGTILTSKVTLRKGSFLGPNTITIGSTAERVTIHNTVIGENTFIGAGTKIGPGVQIGKDIVIGALGYVNKNIEAPGTYVGIPVKKIK